MKEVSCKVFNLIFEDMERNNLLVGILCKDFTIKQNADRILVPIKQLLELSCPETTAVPVIAKKRTFLLHLT